MKRLLILLVLFASSIAVSAQSMEEIEANSDAYLYSNCSAETIEEADGLAVQDLIGQIYSRINATIDMETLSGDDSSTFDQQKMNSFANAVVENTGRLIVSPDEPDVVVCRYIRREDIDNIFKFRRAKVQEYVSYAIEAEQKASIDNALRYYYWAYLMLKSLPNSSQEKYTTGDGEEHLLAKWIPAQMNDIFGQIKAEVIKKKGNDFDVWFSYKGKPVSSLDYTYFDGRNLSNLCQARDGRGVVELQSDTILARIKFRFEYKYTHQARLLSKDVMAAMAAVKTPAFVMATSITELKIKEDFDHSSETLLSFEGNVPVVSSVNPETKRLCESSLKAVLTAISSKQYESALKCFTPEGYEVFVKLIQCGNARILVQDECEYSMLEKQIIARSIPMSFRFKYSALNSFVENVVFIFNEKGEIENLSFGLGEAATNDIMTRKSWNEDVRLTIINFLETYKTAYTLKRFDYISTIFDDDAIMICGQVVSSKPGSYFENKPKHKNVVLNESTKVECVNHLRSGFVSNEFVNLRLDNVKVQKYMGSEIYGIQIRQDYYSTNYGDSGYLLLIVDFAQPGMPVVILRTWQEEIDPKLGHPFSMEDF